MGHWAIKGHSETWWLRPQDKIALGLHSNSAVDLETNAHFFHPRLQAEGGLLIYGTINTKDQIVTEGERVRGKI